MMDVFEQITAVVAHGEVKGAVEALLLLTKAAHLMVPCSTKDTQRKKINKSNSQITSLYRKILVSGKTIIKM